MFGESSAPLRQINTVSLDSPRRQRMHGNRLPRETSCQHAFRQQRDAHARGDAAEHRVRGAESSMVRSGISPRLRTSFQPFAVWAATLERNDGFGEFSVLADGRKPGRRDDHRFSSKAKIFSNGHRRSARRRARRRVRRRVSPSPVLPDCRCEAPAPPRGDAGDIRSTVRGKPHRRRAFHGAETEEAAGLGSRTAARPSSASVSNRLA